MNFTIYFERNVYNMNMTKVETMLVGIYDVLKDIRDNLNTLNSTKKKEVEQNIKESKARMKAANMQLLNETTKKTQERILKNG